MKLNKIFLLCCSTLVLSSCALLGPKYQQPKVDLSPSFKHDGKEQESGIIIKALPDYSGVTWWKSFHDASLDQLIADALANNNDIQIAIGNITAASGQLKAVKMGWVPSLNLGAGMGSGQVLNLASGTSNPLYNQLFPSGTIDMNFYGAGLLPSYSLNIFQQIKKQELANEALERALAYKNAVRLAVISQVAGSYFTLVELNAQLEAQKELVNDLTDLVRLATIQNKYGVVPLTTVKQYQEMLLKEQMQLPDTIHNITLVQNTLLLLCNKKEIDIKTTSSLAKLEAQSVVPANLSSQVLYNRPDIMEAEDQLKMANANIGVARSYFFPTITITAPVTAFSAQLSGLFNPSGDFWSGQILANMPILNMSIYGLIKQVRGQYYVAYYNYVKTVRSAFKEVDDSLSLYNKSNQVNIQASQYYKVNDEDYRLNQFNYKQGYTSYPDSLSSKINLANAKILTLQTSLAKLQALVQVYQAVAGGYNYHNTDEPKKFNDGHDA